MGTNDYAQEGHKKHTCIENGKQKICLIITIKQLASSEWFCKINGYYIENN